jgi:hypothetical protein
MDKRTPRRARFPGFGAKAGLKDKHDDPRASKRSFKKMNGGDPRKRAVPNISENRPI